MPAKTASEEFSVKADWQLRDKIKQSQPAEAYTFIKEFKTTEPCCQAIRTEDHRIKINSVKGSLNSDRDGKRPYLVKKKVITAEGFILRPLIHGDAESLAKNTNNFNVWVNLTDEMPHPYSLNDALWFINHVAPENPVQKMGIEVDGHIAGVLGINILNDVYRKTAGLGYWLGEPYWGRGIMSRAVKAFVPYVFETFDIARIASSAYAHNTGSIRILEKAGFKYEGTLRQHAFKNGAFVDEVKYGMLRSEFEKSL